jgi:tRNA modification GTPase
VGSAAYGDEGPIAALATPPGESALALIRLSGRETIERLGELFSPKERLLKSPGYRIVHGWISAGGERIDEVLVSVYRAPRSYTGEEGADISCHGGPAPVKAILGALRKAGFRDALPGEFTFRAFMGGKLDLTRSESVMELVSAKTDRGLAHAARRLSGALEEEIRGIKRLLAEALAGVEIFLDYSEEDIETEEGSPENFPSRGLAEEALTRLKRLAASYRRERLYQTGALAVIAGLPNAGKSSLFNRLLGEDRSIVTELPGTTRDWIEGSLSFEGVPVRLADTAGLRASEESMDRVERAGVERSRKLLAEADLVLYVIDGSAGLRAGDRQFLGELAHGLAPNPAGPESPPRPLLILWNKIDIAPPPGALDSLSPLPAPLGISARTGEGLAELAAAAAAALEEAADAAGELSPGIATARQKELVDRCAAAVEEALALSAGGEPLDLIAPALREGVNALGEITGELSTADILETMFTKFCVGK